MHEPIAVVISTYNTPDMLGLVLDGYSRQTDRNFKLYVADDGSGSETKALIDQFRKTTSLAIEHVWHKDAGFRKARIHNLVLKQLSEAYVLLTDGDCIPLPGLIAAHRSMARQGCFVSGSRVLLSRTFTATLLQRRHLDTSLSLARILTWRRKGYINRLMPLLMPLHLSAAHQRLSGIRGCHLACWRADLLTVNGFDESFEGWGREDSDLAARLLHAGILRRDLRSMPLLHLWHQEENRHRLMDNDQLLEQCLIEKRIRARKGMAEIESA